MEHDHSKELIGLALRERLVGFGRSSTLSTRLESAEKATDHRLAVELDGLTIEVDTTV